jgi:hypothetical protein
MKTYKKSNIKWKFKNIEELIEYIAHKFDIKPKSNQLIQGTGAQIKSLREINVEIDRAIIFHNPILNHITSPHGEINIGSQSYYINARHLGKKSQKTSSHYNPIHKFITANAQNCYEDFNGLEVCRSEDGKVITYSDGEQSIMFKSYKESSAFFYKEIGTEIKTFGGNFDAAIINSRYYSEAFGQTCTVHKYDSDSDTNDNDLDEYEWGIGSYPAIRVESLCRVQWNGYRLSGVVSTGDQCFVVGGIQPWPEGIWPADWPALPKPDPIESIVISPRSLMFSTSRSITSQTKKITLKSTFANPINVTIRPVNIEITEPESPIATNITAFQPPKGVFSNVSGQLTIPANSTVQLDVTFTGESGLGFIAGNFRIEWPSRSVLISLSGEVKFPIQLSAG